MKARHPALLLLGTVTLVAGVLSASPGAAATPAAASPGIGITIQRACAVPSRPDRMACMALRRTDLPAVSFAVRPNVTPAGYGPADLARAYKLPASGLAPTVAIVDAYNDPNAAADLAVYRTQFGLPACTTASGCFQQVNQNGATGQLPPNDVGWAGEEALDIDMVSAVCPSCHILLVEANSASGADLFAAEDRAVAMGAKFISNSWSGSEYPGQTTDDQHFNHPGVVIAAASGDSGNGPLYPATSRYVTAVGGTHLAPASNSRGWTETAWINAGSGCSAFDAKATWQATIAGCTRRAEADVSAVADPATGVAVYQTFGATGWVVYGGTSVATPIIASVYALAGTPGAADYPASYPYSSPGALFDVTSGNNGTCGAPICTAGASWDGPTGLGTPNGTNGFKKPPPPLQGVSISCTGPDNYQGGAIQQLCSANTTGGLSPFTYLWDVKGAFLPDGYTTQIVLVQCTSGQFRLTVTVTDSLGSRITQQDGWRACIVIS